MTWILFFDGECGFCSKMVRWVAKREPAGNISFAPLQGELARRHDLTRYAKEGGGSMVLLRESDGKVLIRSAAALQVGKLLDGPWSHLARVGSLAPAFLRDFIYRLIAKHRTKLSAPTNACELPDERLKQRMRD